MSRGDPLKRVACKWSSSQKPKKCKFASPVPLSSSHREPHSEGAGRATATMLVQERSKPIQNCCFNESPWAWAHIADTCWIRYIKKTLLINNGWILSVVLFTLALFPILWAYLELNSIWGILFLSRTWVNPTLLDREQSNCIVYPLNLFNQSLKVCSNWSIILLNYVALVLNDAMFQLVGICSVLLITPIFAKKIKVTWILNKTCKYHSQFGKYSGKYSEKKVQQIYAWPGKKQKSQQIPKKKKKFNCLRTGFHPFAWNKEDACFLLLPAYPQTISLKNNNPFACPRLCIYILYSIFGNTIIPFLVRMSSSSTEAVKIIKLLMLKIKLTLEKLLSGIADHLPKSCKCYEKTHTIARTAHEAVLI